jgi:hypothetical protein
MSYFSFNHGQTLTGELIETLKKLPGWEKPTDNDISLIPKVKIEDITVEDIKANLFVVGNIKYKSDNWWQEKSVGRLVLYEKEHTEAIGITLYVVNDNNDTVSSKGYYIYVNSNDKYLFKLYKDHNYSYQEYGSSNGILDTYRLSNYGLEFNKIVFGNGSSITEDGLSGKFVLTDHEGNSLVVRALDGQFSFCPVEMNGECTEWLGVAA